MNNSKLKIYQPEKANKVKMLLYGEGGSGKTTFAASTLKYPEIFGKVLWLNLSGNPQIIVNDKPENLVIFDMLQLSDFTLPGDWLIKGQPEKHPMVTTYGLSPGYDTVVLDGVSDVENLVFERMMPSKGLGDISPKAEFKHWGALLSTLTKIGKTFYEGLSLHVIITAWESYDENGRQWRPSLSGKSADRFPALSPLVARIALTKNMSKSAKLSGDRVLLLDVNESYTKNQLIKHKSLPKWIDDDPDIMDLVKYMSINSDD